MTNNIVAFDFETTGLDVQNDYIIQIGLVKFEDRTWKEIDNRVWYVKPATDFTITEEAFSKHSISKEFILEHGMLLSEIWDDVLEFIGDCDMLSYNGNNYDVPILYYNLLRCNLSFDFSNRTFYDALTIQRARFSNKLSDVYKRYTGKDLDGAHDALNDVRATIEIFKHQEDDKNFDFIKDISNPSFKLVSPENFVTLNENNELVFNQGKYRNKLTNDICKTDPSYIKWVFERFSPLTRKSIREAYYKDKTNKD